VSLELVSSVPELTARVAHAASPKEIPTSASGMNFESVFRDDHFANLYPRGAVRAAPWGLAPVTVMQFAEDLSERRAADAVRGRINWNHALGTAGGAERPVRDEMLEACNGRGLLEAVPAGAPTRPPACAEPILSGESPSSWAFELTSHSRAAVES